MLDFAEFGSIFDMTPFGRGVGFFGYNIVRDLMENVVNQPPENNPVSDETINNRCRAAKIKEIKDSENINENSKNCSICFDNLLPCNLNNAKAELMNKSIKDLKEIAQTLKLEVKT